MGKCAVEIVSDYLRALWEHTLETIAETETPEVVNISKFKVVMTLPAIWPIYAQAKMREAVNLAAICDQRSPGETVLDFISEPEAAALATMQDKFTDKSVLEVRQIPTNLSLRTSLTLQPGDHFVVCDAGGGTTVRPVRMKDLGHHSRCYRT